MTDRQDDLTSAALLLDPSRKLARLFMGALDGQPKELPALARDIALRDPLLLAHGGDAMQVLARPGDAARDARTGMVVEAVRAEHARRPATVDVRETPWKPTVIIVESVPAMAFVTDGRHPSPPSRKQGLSRRGRRAVRSRSDERNARREHPVGAVPNHRRTLA